MLTHVTDRHVMTLPLLVPTWYTIFYINSTKLNASTCFEHHPPIFRRSMSLIIHVCSHWYSHSLQVVVLCTCWSESPFTKCTRRPPAENENTRGYNVVSPCCHHVEFLESLCLKPEFQHIFTYFFSWYATSIMYHDLWVLQPFSVNYCITVFLVHRLATGLLRKLPINL